jgi:hypothetical protein
MQGININKQQPYRQTNEAGDLQSLQAVSSEIGKQTRLVTRMAHRNSRDVVKTICEINSSNLNNK